MSQMPLTAHMFSRTDWQDGYDCSEDEIDDERTALRNMLEEVADLLAYTAGYLGDDEGVLMAKVEAIRDLLDGPAEVDLS